MPGYASLPVGPDPLVYDQFSLNGLLQEVDLFVSVAKMKPHSTTGVTLSMKNLVGIAPLEVYRRQAGRYLPLGPARKRRVRHPHAAGHRRSEPRPPGSPGGHRRHYDVRRRPRTLAGHLAQVRPGVLVASKDPVAADAVATAVMGFDPQAEPPALPFLHGENHLALASQAGLGTHRLPPEIPVVGTPIQEALYRFAPSP